MIKKPVKATKDSLMIEDANGAYIISVCTTREVRDEVIQALNGYGKAVEALREIAEKNAMPHLPKHCQMLAKLALISIGELEDD